MAHKHTIEAYNKIADEYYYRNNGGVQPLYRNLYPIFFKLLPEGNFVLEIGCGIGRDAEVLIDKYEYTGIDAAESMLAIAQKAVPQGKFLVMDFFHLDFPNTTFDGFWAAATLLHVPKQEINFSLQEIKRVLKPNAIGFISVKKKSVFEEGVIKQEKLGIERYFSFYEHTEFKQILERNGFEVLQTTEETEDDPDSTVWLCYFVKVV